MMKREWRRIYNELIVATDAAPAIEDFQRWPIGDSAGHPLVSVKVDPSNLTRDWFEDALGHRAAGRLVRRGPDVRPTSCSGRSATATIHGTKGAIQSPTDGSSRRCTSRTSGPAMRGREADEPAAPGRRADPLQPYS